MDQFGSNLCYTGWSINYLFIKRIMQVDTNLIQTHLCSTQIHEKRVGLVLCCVGESYQTLPPLRKI